MAGALARSARDYAGGRGRARASGHLDCRRPVRVHPSLCARRRHAPPANGPRPPAGGAALADCGAPNDLVSAHLLESPHRRPGHRRRVAGAARARRPRRAGSAVGYLDRAAQPPRGRASAVLAVEARRSGRRAKAVSHLEAAIELIPDPRPRGAAARVRTERTTPAASAGQRIVSARARRARRRRAQRTAVDLEGGYLTSAMHAPAGGRCARSRGRDSRRRSSRDAPVRRSRTRRAHAPVRQAPARGVLADAHRLCREGL
jgi:hypothetical protein